MRYSIFEYSQEKLLEYGLDVTDALILNWFVNFFVGKMEKRVFKGDDGKSRLYGWVKISKIMEDLPVIGISSEKGIRRRMDNLVEKGILERETIQTQNGKLSFYRTTDIYDSLVNSKIKTQEESSQRNSSSYAENDDENSEQKNPQRTKTTYAKNDTEKNDEKSSQRNSSSYADRNHNTFAERNSSSYALNDMLISNMLISNMLITDAAIMSASEKIFGKNAFDDSFPKKAADFLSSQNINDFESYFVFVKDKVAAKNPDNPRGLAYTLIFQNDIAQEFMDKQEQILLEKQQEVERAEVEEKRKVTCPVCGNRFLKDFKTSCPSCEFDIDSFGDIELISWHKKYIQLPKEKREKYSSELCNFLDGIPILQRFSPESKAKQQKFMKELNKKYGLTDTG